MARPSYAEIGDVKIAAEIPDGDTTRDDLINFLIPKVSRAIDGYCKRFFYPLTGTYVHDYGSLTRLWLRTDLDELVEIVNGDGVVVDSDIILLEPINGPPYQWIDLDEGSSTTFRWRPTSPRRSIFVEGTWGYLEDGETPENIQNGCSAWVTYLLKLGKNAGIKSRTIGDYSVSYAAVLDYLRNGPPNEASFYLDSFVRRRFGTNDRATAR